MASSLRHKLQDPRLMVSVSRTKQTMICKNATITSRSQTQDVITNDRMQAIATCKQAETRDTKARERIRIHT